MRRAGASPKPLVFDKRESMTNFGDTPDPAGRDNDARPDDDLVDARKLVAACDAIRKQVAAIVVGQDAVIEQLLIAILARGHCLLEGVPGLAKTLMVRTLAQSMDLTFRRIQFTPDLMPGDITGTEIIQQDPS